MRGNFVPTEGPLIRPVRGTFSPSGEGICRTVWRFQLGAHKLAEDRVATIPVALPGRSYDVLVGPGLMPRAGR